MIDVAYVYDEELNFEGLLLRDRLSGDTLEIQRSIEFDEEDVALGMDTYCLVWQGATQYGGIVDWVIDGSSFTVHRERRCPGGTRPAAASHPRTTATPSTSRPWQHLPTLCA